MMRLSVWAAKYAAVVHALKLTRGNRTRAAKLLGTSRNYLLKLLSDLSVKPGSTRSRA